MLIHAFGGSKLPEGSKLEAEGTVGGAAGVAATGGARMASLTLSPERRKSFLVADVVRGDPVVGDRVFLLIEKPPAGGRREAE